MLLLPSVLAAAAVVLCGSSPAEVELGTAGGATFVGPAASSSPPPLRVAYLHNWLPLGGVETHILALCRGLDRRRIDPAVFLFQDGSGPLVPPVRAAGCNVSSFPVRTPGAPHDDAAMERLVAALRAGRYDAAFTWYGRSSGVPIGVAAPHRAGVGALALRVEWAVDAAPPDLPLTVLEVQNDYVGAMLEGAPYPRRRTGSGVELRDFVPTPRSAGYVRRPGTLTVGRVSRLVAAKDPYTLVAAAPAIAAAVLASTGLATRVLIAGDGDIRGELEALAERLGAAKYVEFVGALSRDAVPGFLDSLDVFVYSTTCDTFGYVLAEAMAMALPVVATDACSVPDIVADGVTGVLVRPHYDPASGDYLVADEYVAAFAAAVSGLASAPSRMRAFGAAGREAVEACCAMPRYLDRHAALLEEAVDAQRRGEALASEGGY